MTEIHFISKDDFAVLNNLYVHSVHEFYVKIIKIHSIVCSQANELQINANNLFDNSIEK